MSHPFQQTPFSLSTMADVTLTKGSKVEVSINEKGFYGSWYEDTLVNIIIEPLRNKKKMWYLVKYDTLYEEDNQEERLSENVDPMFVRPLPPKNVGHDDVEFEVMDVVDYYLREGWWTGVVQSVTVDVGGQKKYAVKSEEDLVEVVKLQNTQMRHHFDWVDSCWKLAPKKETNSEMGGVVDGSVTTSRKRRSSDVENSGDQVARTMCSSASEELTTDIDNQPVCVSYQGLQQKAVLKRSSGRNPHDHLDESSDALIPAAIVENSGTTEYHKRWPFMKRSPIWAAIESHELYRKTPEKPHFAPLKNVREDCREGLAIAHIVTYANVTRTILDLQLNDPINIIKNSLITLAELETHGFKVGAMHARLNKLHAWKVKVCQLEEEVKLFDKDIQKHNGEKSILKEKIYELEEKIKDLQEKLSENVAVKKMNDDNIERLQSNKLIVKNQIKEWELAFEKFAASRF